MRSFDVTIIGSGLAGLQCARLLAQVGAKVILVDRKADLTKGVHTTGIFVRKTFEDFDFPAGTLGRPIRDVVLYSPKLKPLELKSPHDEFRVGRMGELYKCFLDECVASSVEFSPATRFISIEKLDDGSIVTLEKGGERFRIKTDVVVGADGASSKVAEALGLDRNAEWIVGYEEVHKSRGGEPALHCYLDADLAPGYLAWVADDGEEVHVGVGGYAAAFDPREALTKFKKKIADADPRFTFWAPSETRGGRIPVGGVLKTIANEHGLLVGDAAGAVSPLTAGGLDPCIRLSSFAAQVILRRLEKDDPDTLLSYSGERFRARFVSRLWMRRAIALIKSQRILELGCRALRTTIGRKFAAHVFFSRGSFPDVSELGQKREHERAWRAGA
jgi:flavin-dependent dehydrogenase